MFVLPLTRSNHRTALVPQFDRAVDRLFDQSLERIFGAPGGAVRTPALDVTETDAAYTLVLDVPGVSREQLKVSVEGRRVTVETVDAAKAEASEPAPVDAQPQARMLYRERSVARYARTVSLPAEVDQATSSARFENGVLTLMLAKRVATGATRLSIG